MYRHCYATKSWQNILKLFRLNKDESVHRAVNFALYAKKKKSCREWHKMGKIMFTSGLLFMILHCNCLGQWSMTFYSDLEVSFSFASVPQHAGKKIRERKRSHIEIILHNFLHQSGAANLQFLWLLLRFK